MIKGATPVTVRFFGKTGDNPVKLPPSAFENLGKRFAIIADAEQQACDAIVPEPIDEVSGCGFMLTVENEGPDWADVTAGCTNADCQRSPGDFVKAIHRAANEIRETAPPNLVGSPHAKVV